MRDCFYVCSMIFWIWESAGEREEGVGDVEETVNERAKAFVYLLQKHNRERKRGFLFWIFFLFIYLFNWFSLGTWDGDGGILVFTFFLTHIPFVRVSTQRQF